MRVRFDPERPIYQQIVDEFKRAIARGELAPGDRIPSQRELATQARINPNTVQRAYREMEWLGLTETLRGQGTFVVQAERPLQNLRQDMAREAVQKYVAEMSALGFSAEAIVRTVREAAMGTDQAEIQATVQPVDHVADETGRGRKDGKGNDKAHTDDGSDEPAPGVAGG